MMSLFALLSLAQADTLDRVADSVYNVTQTAEAVVTGAIEGLVDLFGANAGLSVAS